MNYHSLIGFRPLSMVNTCIQLKNITVSDLISNIESCPEMYFTTSLIRESEMNISSLAILFCNAVRFYFFVLIFRDFQHEQFTETYPVEMKVFAEKINLFIKLKIFVI